MSLSLSDDTSGNLIGGNLTGDLWLRHFLCAPLVILGFFVLFTTDVLRWLSLAPSLTPGVAWLTDTAGRTITLLCKFACDLIMNSIATTGTVLHVAAS